MFKEGNHASIANRGSTTRRGTPPAQKMALTQMWESLPEEARQRTFTALSRIVAQQMQKTSSQKEVTHEDC